MEKKIPRQSEIISIRKNELESEKFYQCLVLKFRGLAALPKVECGAARFSLEFDFTTLGLDIAADPLFQRFFERLFKDVPYFLVFCKDCDAIDMILASRFSIKRIDGGGFEYDYFNAGVISQNIWIKIKGFTKASGMRGPRLFWNQLMFRMIALPLYSGGKIVDITHPDDPNVRAWWDGCFTV